MHMSFVQFGGKWIHIMQPKKSIHFLQRLLYGCQSKFKDEKQTLLIRKKYKNEATNFTPTYEKLKNHDYISNSSSTQFFVIFLFQNIIDKFWIFMANVLKKPV